MAFVFLGGCQEPARQEVGESKSNPTAPVGMVWVAGQTFSMGSDADWSLPEERPTYATSVAGFWMDRTEVTNRQFAAFVDATGYLTTSERPTPLEMVMAQLPAGSPKPTEDQLRPGSAVFFPAGDSPGNWKYVQGANWRHPEGPESEIRNRLDHPVVHVSWWDAQAYAQWANKALPTEAQWEVAARGGLVQARYTWGNEPFDSAEPQANIWQGEFPNQNFVADGFASTAPVGSFPANGLELFDMAGNVWEWCVDVYSPNRNQQGQYDSPVADESVGALDLRQRSIRGGSFLCSDNYCTRYRPSARTGNTPDSATNHTGFRCVLVPSAAKESF